MTTFNNQAGTPISDSHRDGNSPRDCDCPRDGHSPCYGHHPGDYDTPEICVATLQDVAWPQIMLLLSNKPLYKLTGTDRQADRRTDRQT